MEGQGSVVAKGVLCGEPRWQGGRTGAAGAQSKAKALAQEWREELTPGEWQLDSSGQLLLPLD